MGEGRDYETGIYSLDIGSGAIQWFCKSEARKDDSNWIWQTFDNRSLYFEGEEAHRGFKLVSCPMRPDKELKEAPKKTDVQVVHAFSKFPAALEEKYVLQGMSPSGRYAFVRLGKNISRSRFSFGRVETYYLVDVATGKTRVLLADEVARKTEGAMSGVFWVR